MMEQTTRYNSLDVMKMFMAFLVVGIHVGTITNTQYPQPLATLLSTAVPFFFICSGYFLQNKIIRTCQEGKTIILYFLKTLKLFILWHLAWLPIDIWFLLKNDRSFIDNVIYYFRLLLGSGETIFSWPLWYLHGLLIAVTIIFILRKCTIPLIVIWIISIIVMFIGDAERNGFYQGFPCVATGMLIRQHLPSLPYCLKDRPIYPILRLHSMLVYFLHMYVVLIFYLFKQDYQNPYILWICIFVITELFAYLFDKMRKKHHFCWINHFIA